MSQNVKIRHYYVQFEPTSPIMIKLFNCDSISCKKGGGFNKFEQLLLNGCHTKEYACFSNGRDIEELVFLRYILSSMWRKKDYTRILNSIYTEKNV